ncbi:MAG: DUF1460 domain-containing protein [Bdellovibrio sp.]|nr:DUF1460 domain-containing protein [Bdellovibrio sp.]
MGRSFFNRAGVVLCAVLCAPLIVLSQTSPLEQSALSDLKALYLMAAKEGVPQVSLPQKIEYFSAKFLNKPYLGGALGEGAQSHFDNDPLYRFDAFDCTTYVETVMALALADSPSSFLEVLNRIRYQDGKISLFTRNHFTSLDWTPNAERLGYLRDFTNYLAVGKTMSLTTLIEKQKWYEKQAASMVKSTDLIAEKMQYIKEKTQNLPNAVVSLPYIEKSDLLQNPEMLLHFPAAGVINIVRKNWNVRDAIGTALDISHQGIFFERNGEIIFRHASFRKSSQYVVETPLLDYVRHNLSDPTFAGINVLSLMEHRR